MKLIKKITFIIIFLSLNEKMLFGDVSGFVDSKQCNAKYSNGNTFNPDGTKMFVLELRSK